MTALAVPAKPELMYPEAAAAQLTRPSGSGNPVYRLTGHSNSGFALIEAVASG